MSPLSRRNFVAAVGGAMATVAAGGHMAAAAGRSTGSSVAPAQAQDYNQRFLDQYDRIKDSANGYFSPQGIPYHSVETLMVEAPDHGHETTSEAFSYWLWLEATYGKVTGDWAPFNDAWATMEEYIIPTSVDQPTNDGYDPSSPATYIPEWPQVTSYPSPPDSSVEVGQDPIADELQSTYGTAEIYGMHWLLDVDNTYGYGCTPGTGGQNGPDAEGPSYINTYQRGSEESVWETIPQPSTDLFEYGGPNGYLDLFVDEDQSARQWKYTNAPDADARAVQAAYWAFRWAQDQGNEGEIADTVAKAARMGDYLRYGMYDKYFKRIGNCDDPNSCPGGSGRESCHYLLGWYYAWGGAASDGSWAWRIGGHTAHQGYQNVVAAWALSTVPSLVPESPNARDDWETSLTRQLEFFRWLQSAEGALAGGATNSWNGQYDSPPEGTPTFYGMFYDWQPVYHDPPSNNWFGFQVWNMERVAEYYYLTGDSTVQTLLNNWVAWASAETTVGSDGSYEIPSTLNWTGQPDTWDPDNPSGNPDLHVSVEDYTQDVGVAAAYVKTLFYYAAATGDSDAESLGKSLLDAVATHADDTGIVVSEPREDYERFADEVYVPDGWSGTMPNGDSLEPGATFTSFRSWYRDDPDWPKVQAYLDGGDVPTFRYHRFWAQADIAMAFAVYADLFGDGGGEDDTQPPTTPDGLGVDETTAESVALSWNAATDNVGVAGYLIYRDGTQVGTSSSTSFTDTGLEPETSYGYTVAARDAAGNTSGESSSVTATTAADGGNGDSGCTAEYAVADDWGSGFVAEITVTNNGDTAIDGWSVTWTWGGDQQIGNSWSASVSQSGREVTATNAGWNGSLAPGDSTTFGLQATYSGSNEVPSLTCTAQ